MPQTNVTDNNLKIAAACLKGCQRTGEVSEIRHWLEKIDYLLDIKLSQRNSRTAALAKILSRADTGSAQQMTTTI